MGILLGWIRSANFSSSIYESLGNRTVQVRIRAKRVWVNGETSFMYPLCLQYHDLLHIMFDGALQGVLKDSTLWVGVSPHLKAFAAVFGKRALRDRVFLDGYQYFVYRDM